MKHLSGNPVPGFTLIEVMMAMAIAALVLTALAGLEMALIRSAVQATERLDRIRQMVFFLRENSMKESLVQPDSRADGASKKVTQTIDAFRMTYERNVILKGSSLQGMKDLRMEQVEAQWRGRSDRIVTFVYNPEHQDEIRNKPT